MTVTDIVPKGKGLSALYIDGELALKLDTETLISERLNIGDSIDDRKLKELIDKSNAKRAKEKALWLISYRDYSSNELKKKVSRTSDPDSAQRAVERLEELGLVDDEKFAERYARELINTKHLSVRGAKYKLMEKGVDRELAEEILSSLDPDPQEHIRAVIEKKYANSLSDEKGRRRTVSALQRMGYGWSDINAVLGEYIEEDYI